MPQLTVAQLRAELALLPDDMPICLATPRPGTEERGEFYAVVDLEKAHQAPDDPEHRRFGTVTLDEEPYNALVLWAEPGPPAPVEEQPGLQWFVVEVPINETLTFLVQASDAEAARENYFENAPVDTQQNDDGQAISVSRPYATYEEVSEAHSLETVDWE